MYLGRAGADGEETQTETGAGRAYGRTHPSDLPDGEEKEQEEGQAVEGMGGGIWGKADAQG